MGFKKVCQGLIQGNLDFLQPLDFMLNSGSNGDMMQISEENECSELWFRKTNLQDYRCVRGQRRPVRSLLQFVFILLKYILFIVSLATHYLAKSQAFSKQLVALAELKAMNSLRVPLYDPIFH